ncbi:MAG: hypothetical protein HGB22_02625 [Chlorobiaceae bacterium]|nr:hypothetical protein [Chlorobiaceae bacterium]
MSPPYCSNTYNRRIMKNAIDFLTGNPLILGIAVIISLMIVFSFAKKIIHFLFVLVAIAVLYVAWVTWHGGNPMEKAGKAEQSLKGAVQKGDGILKSVKGLFRHDDPSPGKDKE